MVNEGERERTRATPERGGSRDSFHYRGLRLYTYNTRIIYLGKCVRYNNNTRLLYYYRPARPPLRARSRQ